MKKQYAERDIEDLGEYYFTHTMAMTGEELYGKSAIAAELAHRDKRIAELTQVIHEVQDAWTQPWHSTSECVDRIFKVLERNSHLVPDRETDQ